MGRRAAVAFGESHKQTGKARHPRHAPTMHPPCTHPPPLPAHPLVTPNSPWLVVGNGHGHGRREARGSQQQQRGGKCNAHVGGAGFEGELWGSGREWLVLPCGPVVAAMVVVSHPTPCGVTAIAPPRRPRPPSPPLHWLVCRSSSRRLPTGCGWLCAPPPPPQHTSTQGHTLVRTQAGAQYRGRCCRKSKAAPATPCVPAHDAAEVRGAGKTLAAQPGPAPR
jgi:hypothetical protein